MAESHLLQLHESGTPNSSVSLNGRPKTMPSWGCPPGFGGGKKRIIELKTPSDLGFPECSETRENSVVPPMLNKRSTSVLWILPDVPKLSFGRGPPFPLLKETVDDRAFLCFFTKIYAFSNHFPANFRLKDGFFCCSEQYYMWRKTKHFGFDEAADEIMESQQAKVIKRLGTADTLRERKRKGMEPNAREFDHEEWRKVKEEIMLTALRAKFAQNPKLGKMLVDTKDALLVEASPTDKYWGIGCAIDSEEIEDPKQWQGINRMGILLTRLRHEIRWAER